MMKGKKIKQINNLSIHYTDEFQYSVWTPYGQCWDDRLTLEQAEQFCRETNDFLTKRIKLRGNR
ncbi:MAG: hypothetical protein PHX08_16975 [Lachnospiraceae bacterium]|nr:hypothetical protein [Lachnospiraceae bacterium]